MTALAIYAKEAGYSVTGSDTTEDFPTSDCLKKAGISYLPDFLPEHIAEVKPDMVIFTGAHNGSRNPEVVEAVRQKIAVLPQGKALGMFMEGKQQISIAGSHGKTTTTAMLATIFVPAAHRDASYAIGSGEIFGLGQPGHFGGGDWFIAEADEYVTDPGVDQAPRFLWQHPKILVITNIDFDHPDVYADLAAVKKAYQALIDQMPKSGIVIVSSDDPNSQHLNAPCRVVTVGFENHADYGIAGDGPEYTLYHKGEPVCEYTLRVKGIHNGKNAAMAIVASITAGISTKDIQEGLRMFRGAKRRLEYLGETAGISFYDDYAHHPKEIQATLRAAKSWEHRVFCVFQPHTYSRTKALISEFAKAFADCYCVIITDIYASAREQATNEISGEMLVREINSYSKAHYSPDSEAVYDYLLQNIGEGDTVIFMGAGDIYVWGKELFNRFRHIDQ
jgi:UDP-N-acetylmuramate--alanine ligase